MMDLAKQNCKPCEGGVSSMTQNEVDDSIAKLSGWELKDAKIYKRYTFSDFVSAMQFVNSVAAIAEEQNHHPTISIVYNKVKITLSTHVLNGLSLNDFIIAAKIDKLR